MYNVQLIVLDTTFKDYELIIINDGSLDNTEEIILSYTDSRIVYLKNNLNKGLTFTRNKGIEHANSKYIAWMDADDIALPERLKSKLISWRKTIPMISALPIFNQ
jgi:glycosyltransferase involved in cell wall biosynthesis